MKLLYQAKTIDGTDVGISHVEPEGLIMYAMLIHNLGQIEVLDRTSKETGRRIG